MGATTLKLFILLTQMVYVFTELPVLQKCSLKDSACLRTSGQAVLPAFTVGIPELGVEPLDPMKVDTIKVDLIGLKMHIDNITVKGLRKTVLDKISVDPEKSQMFISWDTDIVLRGHYTASGRLLILPISGDGDITIKLKKLHIDMTANYDMGKMADGSDMIDFRSYKYKHDVKENAHFAVTGLFGGNKLLSDTMLKFMNENWKVLVHEFGGPMLEKPTQMVFEAIQAFFRSRSMESVATM